MNIQPFVLCKVNNNDLVNKSICKHTESSQNFSRAENARLAALIMKTLNITS